MKAPKPVEITDAVGDTIYFYYDGGDYACLDTDYEGTGSSLAFADAPACRRLARKLYEFARYLEAKGR